MTCSSTELRRGGRVARLVAAGVLAAAALAAPLAIGSTSAVFIDDESASASFSTAPDFSAPRGSQPGAAPDALTSAPAPTPTATSPGSSTGAGPGSGADSPSGNWPAPTPNATEGGRPRR